MRVTFTHIGVGCNRVVNALDWSEDDVVAFAAHNSVALYDVKAGVAVGTLVGHSDRVSCCKWIPRTLHGAAAAVSLLASGGSDGIVRIWEVRREGHELAWAPVATLAGEAPQSPVSSITCHALPEHPSSGSAFVLVTTAADESVVVWACDPREDGPAAQQGQWRVLQTLRVPGVIQLCAAVAEVPDTDGCLLLATGGVDSNVRLFARSRGAEFVPVCTLRGHENWVRALAFQERCAAAPDAPGEAASAQLWLASASQDRNVRVWSVAEAGGSQEAAGPLASLTALAPKPSFAAGGRRLEASIAAVLVGHEDWVHSVAWQPQRPDAGGAPPPPRLLSASMDRCMMLWERDAGSGLWMCAESLGDAGPDSLGYYGGCFSPDGAAVLAHGYTGALHMWRRQLPGQAGQGALEPVPSLTGHWDEVVDACWAPDGGFLLTAAADQTVRAWAPLAAEGGRWCEVARPQVHGHNFSAAVCVPQAEPGRYVLASASEEKVIRVLEAPLAFERTLANARGDASAQSTGAQEDGSSRAGKQPLGAAVGALGLSNKAVYDSAADGGESGPDMAPKANPGAVVGAPLEEHLCQSTLWPETHKLYGHGNDVQALAACPRGTCLVSACKAQTPAAAALWVWDARAASRDFPATQQLGGHTLTVTQLSFSRDGAYLLSVSRDRSFCVFAARHAADGAPPRFELLGSRPRAHERIIWSGDWAPCGRLFATGSRDRQLRVWPFDPAAPAVPSTPSLSLSKLPAAVTAVAFAPSTAEHGAYLLAVGFESGALQLLRLRHDADGTLSHAVAWEASEQCRHAAAVRAIRWQQRGDCALMATCGADHTVRVFDVGPDAA